MSDGAHLLIPFAACAAGECVRAREGLALPHLQKLLALLEPGPLDTGDEHSLSMPHDRVLASAFGIDAADGCIPWAAWQVAEGGGDPAGAAWAWITPCHWRVGRDHIAMDHPQLLHLDGHESQALLAAMRPYFEQDGIALDYEAPTRWLARGEAFRGMASASLDRVIGREIDPWLPRDPAVRGIRRLQQEMQMLLYTHPVNEERTRGALLPVNSFWVSGTGALPTAGMHPPQPGLRITHYLRDHALLGEWEAWASAWQQLDARECAALLREAQAGRPVSLTLCGERHARTWSGSGAGLLRRLRAFARARPAATVLGEL